LLHCLHRSFLLSLSGGDRRRCRGRRLARRDEPLRLLEDREPHVCRQPRPEPQRPHFVQAQTRISQLDHVREQRRNRASLDEVNLLCHERGQRLAVDPVANPSSFPLIHINNAETPTRPATAASPTGTVQLRLEA
jgi:hypothetical protein